MDLYFLRHAEAEEQEADQRQEGDQHLGGPDLRAADGLVRAQCSSALRTPGQSSSSCWARGSL